MIPNPDQGPAPIDASLHLLADHLLEAVSTGDLAPALLHVSAGDADGFDLGMLPLDGRHPSELLVGLTAPDEWHAIGVATAGWAYRSSERGRADRTRTRVHVVTVLSRTGEHAHRTRVEDAGAMGMSADDLSALDQPAEGEQVDLLRLALGLTTDPPPCGAEVYWAIVWLSEILARPDELTEWRAVRDLHPGMETLRRARVTDVPTASDADVVALLRLFARAFDWSELRRRSGEGGFEVDELRAADAWWFDDGAFARFVLNRCPPLAMLRTELEARLSPPLVERVHSTLDALEIPPTAWPDRDDRAA
jgi:hypothetical protein